MSTRITLVAAGVLAASSLLASSPARADNDVVVTPAPSANVTASTETTEVNTPVIASGVVTFGLAYGAGLVTAGMADSGSPDRRMFVPVVGPWLDLADRPKCPVGEVQCDPTTTKKILIGADGVVQAIGLITAVYGMLTPIHETYGGVQVAPVTMGDHGNGLAVAGSF